MPKKLLTIFGSTGHQGSSLISHILSTPSLDSQYAIRAITRSSTSAPSLTLSAQGVEVQYGDLDVPSSIPAALVGTHTVFLVTASIFSPGGSETEYAQAKTVADACIAAGVSYLIFSTLPSASAISNGRLKNMHAFDVKAKIESYIRGLPLKSAFYAPGCFMQNFLGALKPRANGEGGFVLETVMDKETRLPLLDVQSDTGRYVGAMLEDVERFVGKSVCAAAGFWTLQEIVESIGRRAGKTVRYGKVEAETMRSWGVGEDVVEMMVMYRDFGYWGSEGEELVNEGWGVVDRKELMGLEGFMQGNRVALE